MGWLFAWDTRKELIEHLVNGNGVKTRKHCCVGNNLWAIQEGTLKDGTKTEFIALYLMRGRDNRLAGWGYKDMDESAGPTTTSCPPAYLKEVPDPKVGYSTEWRARVLSRALKAKQKFSVGQMVKLRGKTYTVTEVLPHGKYRLDGIYTSTRKHTRHMEVVT